MSDQFYEATDQSDDEVSAEVTQMLAEFDERGLPPAQDVGPGGQPMGDNDPYVPVRPTTEPQGPLGLRPTQQVERYRGEPDGYPPDPVAPEAPQEPAPVPEKDVAQQLAEANARLAMYQSMLGGATAPGIPPVGMPPGMATPTAQPGFPPQPGQTATFPMAPQPPQPAAQPPTPAELYDFLGGADHRDLEPKELNQKFSEAMSRRDQALWERFSQKAAEISLNTMATAAKNTMDYEAHINAPGNEWVKQDQQGFDWCLQETQHRYPHLAHDMAAQCQVASQRLKELRTQAGYPSPGAPQAAMPPTRAPQKAHIPRVAPAASTRIPTGTPPRKGQAAFMDEFFVGHKPEGM